MKVDQNENIIVYGDERVSFNDEHFIWHEWLGAIISNVAIKRKLWPLG